MQYCRVLSNAWIGFMLKSGGSTVIQDGPDLASCAPNWSLTCRVPGFWVSGSLESLLLVDNSGCRVSGVQGFRFPGTHSLELLELASESALLSAPWVQLRHSSKFKNNCSAEIWSSSEEGLYLRLMDWCITQLRARKL